MMKNETIETTENTYNPYVVIGAFEDSKDLMNKSPYYRIRLDGLVMPEEKLVIKEFFGTQEQIGELLNEIDKDVWWREYYAYTLDAWEKYQAGDHDAVHFVGSDAERLLTPVTEICRSAYLIDNARWRYKDKYGCIMLADADMVDVNQVLLQDGYRYIRCARYWFEGLCRVHSDKGWVFYDGVSRGIPCLMKSLEEGTANNRLFVIEGVYDDVDSAMADMQKEAKFHYQQISRELFTGC